MSEQSQEELVSNMFILLDAFNRAANIVFNPNIWFHEYRIGSNTFEFTVYWSDNNGNGRHRLDIEFSLDKKWLSKEIQDQLVEESNELYVWEITGKWPN